MSQVGTHSAWRILTKLQLPNLDQIYGSKCWPIFCHKISNKLQPQNFDQIPASKSWPKINFKILTKLQLQYRDQKQGSKSLPNFSFKISIKLLSTCFSASTSATLTTTRSFELASSKARVTSVKELVSELVKGSQWSDLGPIKSEFY